MSRHSTAFEADRPAPAEAVQDLRAPVNPDPDQIKPDQTNGATTTASRPTIKDRFRRLGMILKGQLRAWNETNLAALGACRDLLTAEATKVLADFGLAHTARFRERIDGSVGE